jgi:hypothetical protein
MRRHRVKERLVVFVYNEKKLKILIIPSNFPSEKEDETWEWTEDDLKGDRKR